MTYETAPEGTLPWLRDWAGSDAFESTFCLHDTPPNSVTWLNQLLQKKALSKRTFLIRSSRAHTRTERGGRVDAEPPAPARGPRSGRSIHSSHNSSIKSSVVTTLLLLVPFTLQIGKQPSHSEGDNTGERSCLTRAGNVIGAGFCSDLNPAAAQG